jgi:cyclic beta-1,2-glucan synthetase
MYRAGVESILGLRRRGSIFGIDPCVPAAWPAYRISWRFGSTHYEIEVANPERRCRGVARALFDGRPVSASAVPLVDDGKRHSLEVVLGRPAAPQPGRPTGRPPRG